MKFIKLILLFATSASCAFSAKHKVPDDQNKFSAFQYCGGEVWGYMIDLLGQPQSDDLLSKRMNPRRPFLAIYLRLDTKNTLDPEKALKLWYVIRSRDNFKLNYPDPTLLVKVNDEKEKKIRLNLTRLDSAPEIYDLYNKAGHYIVADEKVKNQWRVRKKEIFGTDGPVQVVKLEQDKITKNINEKSINFISDLSRYKATYFEFSYSIWPYKEGLSNASFVVKTPKMILNGKEILEQRFKFNMNFADVMKDRGQYFQCPDKKEIFRFNI